MEQEKGSYHSNEKLSSLAAFTDMIEKVKDSTFAFMESQIKIQKLSPKARRYSVEQKTLSLSLKLVVEVIACCKKFLFAVC